MGLDEVSAREIIAAPFNPPQAGELEHMWFITGNHDRLTAIKIRETSSDGRKAGLSLRINLAGWETFLDEAK